MMAMSREHAVIGAAPRRTAGSPPPAGIVEMADEPRAVGWRPASPKLTPARASWYRYYAGLLDPVRPRRPRASRLAKGRDGARSLEWIGDDDRDSQRGGLRRDRL